MDQQLLELIMSKGADFAIIAIIGYYIVKGIATGISKVAAAVNNIIESYLKNVSDRDEQHKAFVKSVLDENKAREDNFFKTMNAQSTQLKKIASILDSLVNKTDSLEQRMDALEKNKN